MQKAASKVTNGDAFASPVKKIRQPVADQTNGKLNGATDVDAEYFHRVLPDFDEVPQDAITTVHKVSYSAFGHSSERDEDTEFGFSRRD